MCYVRFNIYFGYEFNKYTSFSYSLSLQGTKKSGLIFFGNYNESLMMNFFIFINFVFQT